MCCVCRSFVLQIVNSNGKGYVLEIHRLLKSIIPESSNVKVSTFYLYAIAFPSTNMQVKNDMVVLNLFKKSQEKWSHLTAQEKKFNDSKLVILYYICYDHIHIIMSTLLISKR